MLLNGYKITDNGTLTNFIRGSITVWVISSLTGLNSTLTYVNFKISKATESKAVKLEVSCTVIFHLTKQ